MSGYLSDRQFADILSVVSIYPIGWNALKDLSTYSFDTGIAKEYKDFLLREAKNLDELAISKTFIMIHI